MVATLPTTLLVPADVARAVARAGIDANRADGATREVLRAAIASRQGLCYWAVEPSGWVVTLLFPEERAFAGSTLEEGLARCLAWLTERE